MNPRKAEVMRLFIEDRPLARKPSLRSSSAPRMPLRRRRLTLAGPPDSLVRQSPSGGAMRASGAGAMGRIGLAAVGEGEASPATAMPLIAVRRLGKAYGRR